MERLKSFISSMLAGIMVGVGCLAYLSCYNQYMGAMLFSIGLLTILVFEFNLFTGQVGYIRNFKELIFIWCGNLTGMYIMSLFKHTRLVKLQQKAIDIVSIKELDSYLSLFLLSIGCGLLMFVAVDTYRNNHPVIGVVSVVFCVSVFILIGFEHCIANMFYFLFTNKFFYGIIRLMVITVGNSIGANIIPMYKKLK